MHAAHLRGLQILKAFYLSYASCSNIQDIKLAGTCEPISAETAAQ